MSLAGQIKQMQYMYGIAFQNDLFNNYFTAAQVIWYAKGHQSPQGLGNIRGPAWHTVKGQHHPGSKVGTQSSAETDPAPGRKNL